MRMDIREGKALLVDGPACVTLHSGTMTALGARIKVGDYIVVRRGKRIPLRAIKPSEVELLLGNPATYSMIDDDPIPLSWKEAAERTLSKDGRVMVAVLGGIDSGKTSFCTYLANMALNGGRRTALVDGDLGQSDVGPPGTLGLSLIEKPVTDLFTLQPDRMIFLGVTSPRSAIEQTINGLLKLKDEAENMGSDFIIVDTDGWIDGADAVSYKHRLIRELKPDFVIAIEGNGELKPIMGSLTDDGVKILMIETPKNIKKRDRETRKLIRETSYRKYLREAKVRSYPLSWIKVSGILEIRGKIDRNLKERAEEILGDKVIYCENLQEYVFLALKEGTTLSDEEKEMVNAEFSKPVKIMREGDERGLFVALEDEEGNLLGVGTIYCVDFERSTLKVYTNVESPVSRVHVGRIRLDERGSEIEILTKDL